MVPGKSPLVIFFSRDPPVSPKTSGLVSGGGTQKIINVFPSDGLTVVVYCYYYDGNPTWNYVTISGKPVYDVSQSVGFRISSRCHGELVVKILEYLYQQDIEREAEVVQYAQANELKADS